LRERRPLNRAPLSGFLHLPKGPPLGGFPHKNGRFFEWEPTCVGASSGAWSLSEGPLSGVPSSGGLLSGAHLSMGPIEWGPPLVGATLSGTSLELGLLELEPP
jgi:hypothetical protein